MRLIMHQMVSAERRLMIAL